MNLIYYRYFNKDIISLSNKEFEDYYFKNLNDKTRIYNEESFDKLYNFNLDFYKEFNKDLFFINDNFLYRKHFIDLGKNENRIYNEESFDKLYNFILDYYLKFNNDLVYLNDSFLYRKHFNDIGKEENRIYNENTFSEVFKFNLFYYKEFNLDLSYLNNDISYREHFIDIGKEENRIYNEIIFDKFYNFEIDSYKEFNLDLSYLNNDMFYRKHFIDIGKEENRIYNIDFLINLHYPYFNTNIYLKFNDNLILTDEKEIKKHFINFNKNPEKFLDKSNNYYFYKRINLDLQNLSDINLINHFLKHGYNEKRIYSERIFYENFPNIDINYVLDQINLINNYDHIRNITNNINVVLINNFDITNVLNIDLPNSTIFDEYISDRHIKNISLFDNYYKLDIHTKYFYWLKRSIEEKKISIISPFTNNYISSDKYYITLEYTDILPQPYSTCTFYFKEERTIVGIGLGSGLGGMASCRILYIYNFDVNKIYYTWIDYDFSTFKNSMFLKIYNNYLKSYTKNLMDEDSKIITIYGFMNNLGHMLFNDITGLFLLNYNDVVSKIDKVIIGTNDAYFIKNFFIKKNIIEIDDKSDISTIDNYFGKGIFFKYNHFFISEKCLHFLKVHLNNQIENFGFEDEIYNIKKNHYPIINVVLRKGFYEMNNQGNGIAEIINRILERYPNAFFYFDGFCGSKYLLDDDIIGYRPSTHKKYDVFLKYDNTVQEIISKINTNNYKSLINKYIYEIIKYVEISDYAIYQIGSACTYGGWLCNIPGIQFGRPSVRSYENMDKNIRENMTNILYLDYNINFEENSFTLDINSFMNLLFDNIPPRKNYRILWGKDNNYFDVTYLCYKYCIRDNRIVISENEMDKLRLFGDPYERIIKNIKIIDMNGNIRYYGDEEIVLDINSTF